MFEWTFGRRLALGFVVAGLTLILVAGFGYANTHRLIENDRWVSHTQQVRRDLASLLGTITDAETGERGFALSGDESFLDPYRAALAPMERVYGDLQRTTADNPRQQQRLALLRPLLDAFLVEMKAVVDLRRAAGLEATARRVAGGEGNRMVNRLHESLAQMDADEESLLAVRRQDAEASAEMTKSVILWGSVLGVALVAAAGVLIARALARQLGAAAQHMQSSSTELQTAASQQAAGAREQATAMTEISTTVSELLATSRQIADGSQRVAQIAEQTAAAVRAGDAVVDLGRESLAAIRRQVDAIVSHMLELGKKSQQIGLVLEVVGELAEQTNILAINATIEAAGAADAGKRFGVVADEIRKLADRVGGSTKEIRTLIEDVRGAVNTTVMTTETGSKAVEAGARQFNEVAAAFKQIAAQVVTTTEAAREIGLSTKQQASAVEQVNTAIVNVSQASKESEVSTVQTLQTASEIATLSSSLLRIVQSNGSGAYRASA